MLGNLTIYTFGRRQGCGLCPEICPGGIIAGMQAALDLANVGNYYSVQKIAQLLKQLML
jgi:Fe-S-cluster-containing hydrogenase component 2